MAATNVFTIDDRATARVCTLAGLQLATKRLATFVELQAGLQQSIKDLERQSRRDDLMSASLVILRFTKATCDGFIGLAAALSSTRGTKLVSNTYGVGSVVADAVGTKLSGGKVDLARTGIDLANAGANFAGGSNQFLIKNGVMKAEMINSALNSDIDGVKKTAINYGFDLAGFTLESLGEIEAVTFLDIAKTSFDYHQELGESFDEYFTNKQDSADRVAIGRSMIKRQAEQFSRQIDNLMAFIQSCSASLSVHQA